MKEGNRTMELLLDGYCGETELLRDEEKLREWLLETAKVGEMHYFGEPIVVDFPFPGQVGTALSAVLWLGESSILVHTYPEHSFVFMNVFHCQEFNVKKVLDWIKESFGITQPRTFLFERGIDKSGKPITTRPYTWSGIV